MEGTAFSPLRQTVIGKCVAVVLRLSSPSSLIPPGDGVCSSPPVYIYLLPYLSLQSGFTSFSFLSSPGASDFLGGGGRSGTKANAGATASAAQSAAAPAASAADSGGGDKGKVAQELGANLELGELEQLTITNDNESSYDVSLDADCSLGWI